MGSFAGLMVGIMLFTAWTFAVGCRLIGGFGRESNVAVVDRRVVFSGQVALANDVDTGLLANIRVGVASGAEAGPKTPVTGLNAQLYSSAQGATLTVALPVSVSASGTFSFTISHSLKDFYVRAYNTSETLVRIGNSYQTGGNKQ
jgi:hypothetical protein